MNTMMLVTSNWKKKKSFRLIPVSPECPYNEVIFDMDERVLAIVSKEKKQSFHMMARLDDTGEPVRMKRPRTNGKDFAEERKTLETYYEYYIEHPEEISNFINLMAINSGQFDYSKYIEEAYSEPVGS